MKSVLFFIQVLCILPVLSKKSLFSSPKDLYTTSLTSSNFNEKVRNSTQPWFVYLAYPKFSNSELSNQNWTRFAAYCSTQKFDLNFGKINLSQEKSLARSLNCTKTSAYFYIDQGYKYNYIGSKDPRNLEKVYTEQTYLQYQRTKIEFEDFDDSNVYKAKLNLDRKPIIFLIRTFILAFIIQTIVFYSCCRPTKLELKPKVKIN